MDQLVRVQLHIPSRQCEVDDHIQPAGKTMLTTSKQKLKVDRIGVDGGRRHDEDEDTEERRQRPHGI